MSIVTSYYRNASAIWDPEVLTLQNIGYIDTLISFPFLRRKKGGNILKNYQELRIVTFKGILVLNRITH